MLGVPAFAQGARGITPFTYRAPQAALGRIPQFRTTLDGLRIHFIHVRSKHPNALPIVMTHGWPGSIIEFMEIVAPLTNPTARGGRAEDAFHFVAPSLPGFGFSDKPSARGWNADRIAKAWGEVMGRLGYQRFVAPGGDWGTFVTTRMAQLQVPGLAAIHLTMPQVIPNKLPATPTAQQQRALDTQKRFETDQFGYFALQMTRPQTIGYPLADSPAGQAARIYEKFHAWTNNNSNPEDALTRDQMLDNITLYWLTDSAASSARIIPNTPAWANPRMPASSIFRSALASSRAKSFRRRAPGPNSSFPSSFTGTNPRAAVISRHSKSRSCSPRKCATSLAQCAVRPRSMTMPWMIAHEHHSFPLERSQ